MRRAAWPFAALAAGALACSSSRGAQAPCNSVDKLCQDGEVCFEDGCGPALVFAVRVSPNTPGYVVQDFNPVSVATSVVDLTLGDSGDLSGTLKIMRNGQSSDYVADPLRPTSAVAILARGHSSSIPGLAFDDPASAVVREGSEFSLIVPPRGLWSVSAIPIDVTIPAALAVARVAERGISSQGNAKPVVVTLPGEPGPGLLNPDLLKISGVLQRAAGHPFPAGAEPLYRLQALGGDGAALSQQISARAGSEFVVWAQNASGAVVLRATPDPAETAPLPSRDFTRTDGKFGAFELGDFGDAVKVRGRIQDSSGAGIPFAKVELTGVVQGGLSTFRALAHAGGNPDGTGADAVGAFEVLLLPPDPKGGYTATATPPADSRFAAQKSPVDVASASGIVVVCPEKVLLSGTVVASAGDPASGIPLLIEGYPVSGAPGPTTVRIRTDSGGAFSARVETGGYRVVAMPSLESKMAWGSQRVQVDGPTSVALSLPDARQVSGTIQVRQRGGTTRPLPNASVTFYRSDAAAPSEKSYPIKLWEAITDSQGKFRVNLPKSGTPVP
jgi:hypothetical protein